MLMAMQLRDEHGNEIESGRKPHETLGGVEDFWYASESINGPNDGNVHGSTANAFGEGNSASMRKNLL